MLLLFCVEPYLMRLAVTMFILGVGTSPGSKARVGKSNTMNAGVGGGRPLTSPAPGSVGRRSTISSYEKHDQAKTSSSSTERTNEVSRYSDIQLFLSETCDLYTKTEYRYDLKINIVLRDSLLYFFYYSTYSLFSIHIYGILDMYLVFVLYTLLELATINLYSQIKLWSSISS